MNEGTERPKSLLSDILQSPPMPADGTEWVSLVATMVGREGPNPVDRKA